MATTYTTPGVYVEEVPSSSATLTAGATAVAAFVGFTAKAPPIDDPVNDPKGLKPRMVTSWTQYESLYGGFAPGIMLPHSVYGYFNNGGSVAYIVRIPHNVPAKESGTLALTAGDRTLGPAVEFTTVEPNAPISVNVTPRAEGRRPEGSPVVHDHGHRDRRGARGVRGRHADAGEAQHRHGLQGSPTRQGRHEDRHDQARQRPGVVAGRHVRHRASATDPVDARRHAHSPAMAPSARASKVSSSPTTSPW